MKNKNLLVFGASHSSTSINKKFATYTSSLFQFENVDVIDLNDYELPLFTIDLESTIGFPINAEKFLSKVQWADFIIISLAEHNGSYTASFKNLFDWVSRIKMKLFENKKILLLSTSTGSRGGVSVMNSGLDRFPRHGAEILASFSLPSFSENFTEQQGIINEEIRNKYETVIQSVKQKLSV
jgi:chromate reductase, NAD(P)H dehydrogenase (quinone)